jgi:hypothetical protein
MIWKNIHERIAGVIRVILWLVDICMDMVSGKRAAPSASWPEVRNVCKDRLEHQFPTSAGTVRIRWRRLACSCCSATTIPLRDFWVSRRINPRRLIALETNECKMRTEEMKREKVKRRERFQIPLINLA